MKKYKLIILTNVLIALTAFTGISQNNKSTLDQLKASTWELEVSVDKQYLVSFEGNSATHQFFEWETSLEGENFGPEHVGLETSYLELGFTMISEYYLSDTQDAVFDASKIGQATEGKYIIERYIKLIKDGVETPKDSPIFSVLEIQQVNKNFLMLKAINNPHTLKYTAL